MRGWGLINGIELSENSGVTAADVTKILMENGVLVVPAGPKVSNIFIFILFYFKFILNLFYFIFIYLL